MGFDRLGDVGENAAFLEATGLDHGQSSLDEPAPVGTLGAEAEFAPDHRVTERPLGRVVGRLDAAGDTEAAHESLRAVLRLDPGHPQAGRKLGELERAAP